MTVTDLTPQLRLAQLRGQTLDMDSWLSLLTGHATADPDVLPENLRPLLSAAGPGSSRETRSRLTTGLLGAPDMEEHLQTDEHAMTGLTFLIALCLQAEAEACEHDPDAPCPVAAALRETPDWKIMILDMQFILLIMQIAEQAVRWDPYWIRVMLDAAPPDDALQMAQENRSGRQTPWRAGWLAVHQRRLGLTPPLTPETNKEPGNV